MEKFSEILNDLILESGLSLRALATKSKVSAVQYGKYLKGSYPRVEVAVRIANYFNCSLDYLFGISNIRKIKNYKEYDISQFVNKYIKLLEQNDITHWKFAKENNISESSLRHWKYGEVPSMESLIKIAENLSSSIDYLIGRCDA